MLRDIDIEPITNFTLYFVFIYAAMNESSEWIDL